MEGLVYEFSAMFGIGKILLAETDPLPGVYRNHAAGACAIVGRADKAARQQTLDIERNPGSWQLMVFGYLVIGEDCH